MVRQKYKWLTKVLILKKLKPKILILTMFYRSDKLKVAQVEIAKNE